MATQLLSPNPLSSYCIVSVEMLLLAPVKLSHKLLLIIMIQDFFLKDDDSQLY